MTIAWVVVSICHVRIGAAPPSCRVTALLARIPFIYDLGQGTGKQHSLIKLLININL